MESPVEQVRAGVDVVDLISNYVTLKKAGRTYKALCPFHSEKTPSFVVFPGTGRWHCFGCGEGGDVFTFVMKVENLTFSEALRRLADRIGVVVTSQRENVEQREANKRLYAANEAAAVYFHDVLLNSPHARRYVASRGITDETLRGFLLGLAPDANEAMMRHLLGQDFTREELLAAGLLYEPENGPLRDRYHGRVMFPIRDAEGRIVSFGARGLSADAVPKYLNGPQTDLFDKGSTLYGMPDAAAAIRREQRAVIVEGYVDVVIAHQCGFQNVVATLGTAITDRHLRQLARLAPSICLALDADEAGQTAAMRGAEVAREALTDAAVPVPTWRGLIRYEAGSRASIGVAVLPDGKDPDELILEDPDRWREVIASARPVIEHALEGVVHQHDVSTAQGKAEAAEALVPLLLDVPDPIQRAHYVELAAQRLHVDSQSLQERLRRNQASGTRNRRGIRGGGSGLRAVPEASTRTAGVGQALDSLSPTPSAQPPTPGPMDQQYAAALVVAAVQRGLPHPGLDPMDFTDPSTRALVLRITDLLASSARDDWRPDLLVELEDPWLAGSVAGVRALLDDVGRLTDAQLASEADSIRRQLREARLAMELREHSLALQEAESDVAERIKARIAENNRERFALQKEDSSQARGPTALGRRVPAVPARFRIPAGD
jgi:DNA primase catalytic core